MAAVAAKAEALRRGLDAAAAAAIGEATELQRAGTTANGDVAQGL